MLFRPTLKLAAKIGVKLTATEPLSDDVFADWSANLFMLGRTQYLIVTNTFSLFSVILPAKGITTPDKLMAGTLARLQAYMTDNEMLTVFQQHIAPAFETEVKFAKALNRSVTGSMVDLINAAKVMASVREVDAYKMPQFVNSTPLSAIEYRSPSDCMMAMKPGQTAWNKRIPASEIRANQQGKSSPSGKPSNKTSPATVYQFRITLLGSQPPIWRRIQVRDCTLDRFHDHIQTAMGWTNSHLHQFVIGKQLYCNPEFFDDDLDDFREVKTADSTRTKLSQILPTGRKQFKFRYEYDFGDGWEHEVLFEGSPQADKSVKYPLCLEGERNCPPEDVGGIGGFYYFLEAVSNPRHEYHSHYRDWGKGYNAAKFDAAETTKVMRDGLPYFG